MLTSQPNEKGNMENKIWYERKQPLKLRVWDGCTFTNECSFIMGKEGIEVIGADGNPKEDAKIQVWTGCLDREGHEIFEGDYLMLTDEGHWIGAVVFNGGSFCCLDENGFFSSDFEWENELVVGNVFTGLDKALIALERERCKQKSK